MKATLASAFLFSTAISAFALSPGDKVTVDAIGQSSFVKGEAPAKWETDKLYVLECWATWCGPCIAAIPHIDGLYDKYQEKGLRVIGMNVWEDGEDKVKQFVDDQGDKMSYPIAYVGKGGVFEKEWLTPAGVRGIPNAFIVKNGEYLFSTHPASLTEETIESLLEGGEKAEAVISEVRDKAAKQDAIQAQLREFTQGDQTNDAKMMEAALVEIEKIDPEFTHLNRMKIDVAMAKQDWDAATEGLKSLDDERMALMTSVMSARKFDSAEEAPPAKLLELFVENINKSELPDPMMKATLARLNWKLDKKEEALAAAKEAENLHNQLPKEPFSEFVVSFEKGEPQSLDELMTALRAAMQANGG